MFVLGLRVATEGSRWTIRGVLIDLATGAVAPATIDHFPNRSHDEPLQAHEAHDAIASALRGHEIGAVVLREADHHGRAGLTAGTKKRLRLEGACLSACRATGVPVSIMDGKAIGTAIGGSKNDAWAAANMLGVADESVDAAAAALAAKTLL